MRTSWSACACSSRPLTFTKEGRWYCYLWLLFPVIISLFPVGDTLKVAEHHDSVAASQTVRLHQTLNVLSAGSVFSGPQVLNVRKMQQPPLAIVTSGRCQLAVCGLAQYYPVDSVGANVNETSGTQL